MINIILIIVSFIICSAYSSLAGVYYVNNTTSNTTWASCNDISTPCTPVAAMANAVAGDTVYFRGGIYELGQSDNNQSGAGVLTPSNSGTSDLNRIIFSAYPGETPILNTTVSGQVISRAWGDTGHDYTTLYGFTITSTGNYSGSVGIGGSSIGTVIDHCTFIGGVMTNTDNISGIAIQSSYNLTVQYCTFTAYRDSADNHNTSAIKQYLTDGLTVKNCEFRNSTVAIYNKQAGINNMYENNYIYDSKVGITLETDNTGDMSNTIIRNNIIVDSSYVAVMTENKNGNLTPDLWIYNNTIFNSASSSRLVSINNATGRYIYNNIISGDASDGEVRFVNASTIDQMDHNRFYSPSLSIVGNLSTYSTVANWQASNELTSSYDAGCGASQHPGCGSSAGDPVLVAPTGGRDTIAEFELGTGSPCIAAGRSAVDIGADVSLVGVDADGTATITCYPDIDNDLYPGSGSETVETCSANYYESSHFTAMTADCDDTDPDINPGTPDICGNSIAENCAADVPCPIPGVCGTAAGQASATEPTTGLCTTGTPGTVTRPSDWSWPCYGIDGGADADPVCSAPYTAPGGSVHLLNLGGQIYSIPVD